MLNIAVLDMYEDEILQSAMSATDPMLQALADIRTYRPKLLESRGIAVIVTKMINK